MAFRSVVAVERVAGQARATDVNVEVEILVPLTALVDPDHVDSAEVVGYDALPGGLLAEVLGVSQGRKLWRRLFTVPRGGATTIAGCDPTARQFTGTVAKLIELRDQRFREPFCDAAIRHFDHVVPYRDGGLTTYANGRGVCERHNYVRELPGWRIASVDLDDPSTSCSVGSPHVVITPTGHHYLSRAPDPP